MPLFRCSPVTHLQPADGAVDEHRHVLAAGHCQVEIHSTRGARKKQSHSGGTFKPKGQGHKRVGGNLVCEKTAHHSNCGCELSRGPERKSIVEEGVLRGRRELRYETWGFSKYQHGKRSVNSTLLPMPYTPCNLRQPRRKEWSSNQRRRRLRRQRQRVGR